LPVGVPAVAEGGEAAEMGADRTFSVYAGMRRPIDLRDGPAEQRPGAVRVPAQDNGFAKAQVQEAEGTLGTPVGSVDLVQTLRDI